MASDLLYPKNMRVRDSIFEAMKRTRLLDAKRVVKSLVMISGGLDSVALLANLLQHTTHDVHAHHVEISNAEKRVQAENETLDKALSALRKQYRAFTYSTSKYELMLDKGGGLDMTLVMFMAARVNCATESITELVWTGHMAQTATCDFMESSAVFTACSTNYRFKPVWLTPFISCRKIDIYASIPPELADMTWSCRTPRYEGARYTRCGECHACKTRADIGAEVKRLQEQGRKAS